MTANHCQHHRELYNEKARLKKTLSAISGICEMCQSPVEADYLYCQYHQERRTKQRRIRKNQAPRKLKRNQ